MCVVSMVIDHYNPFFPPLPEPAPTPTVPNVSGTFTWPPPSVDLNELRKLIEEFKEAMVAAKKVDLLTGQPDCEDPEKAKLVARVDALEKEVARLSKKKRPSKRKPAKGIHGS